MLQFAYDICLYRKCPVIKLPQIIKKIVVFRKLATYGIHINVSCIFICSKQLEMMKRSNHL